MEVMTLTAPVEDDLAVFKRHVVKRTQMVLARVLPIVPVLPPKVLKEALHILDYAFNLPEAWPDTRRLLLAMAPKLEQAGYRDEWMPYLEQGIHHSRLAGDTEARAELQLQLGILHELRGAYERARVQLEAGVRDFERLKRPRDQARALNRLAYLARQQHRFEEAAERVKAALELLDQGEAECGHSYLVLGAVALDRRDWQQATKLFQQSFEVWQKSQDKRMMARSLTGLGAALRALERYEEALTVYQQAEALFKEIQDQNHQAAVQVNLGNVYLSLEQPLEALKFYRPAERVLKQVQDRLRLAQVQHNIGLAHHQLKQWPQAEEAYLASIRQKQEIGIIAALVYSMDGLGLVYAEQGRWPEARAIFEQALSWLSQIKEHPRYRHLFGEITAHLQEVLEKNGCR